MTGRDKLEFVLILYDICLHQDIQELKLFIFVSSRYMETNDFNTILRKTMRLLENKKCGDVDGPDWLINELFKLYKRTEI